MIGRHHQQIVLAQPRQQRGQARVEPLEVRRIPGDVVAMAEVRVEIDEVREDRGRGRPASICRIDLVHALIVARGVDRLRHAAAGEQILDLADGDDRQPGGLDAIEQRLAARRQRVVVAIGRPRETAGRADERPRDDAADAEALAHELVRDLARAVQLRHGHDRLVRGDLKHAVGRRVDDQRAGPHVLRRRARR